MAIQHKEFNAKSHFKKKSCSRNKKTKQNGLACQLDKLINEKKQYEIQKYLLTLCDNRFTKPADTLECRMTLKLGGKKEKKKKIHFR
jgi:hypothetical protein